MTPLWFSRQLPHPTAVNQTPRIVGRFIIHNNFKLNVISFQLPSLLYLAAYMFFLQLETIPLHDEIDADNYRLNTSNNTQQRSLGIHRWVGVPLMS